MNQDFRVSVGFLNHPKIKKLRRRLGADGVCSLLGLWACTAAYKPDGILTDMDPQDLELAADWTGEAGAFFDALTELRLIDEDNGVFSIHDWRDHNGYAFFAKQRSEKARKAAAARWEKPEGCGSDATSMRVECSPHNKCYAPSPSPSPAPKPSPAPEPKKEPPKPPARGGSGAPLSEIVSYLNEKSGKAFKPGTPATAKAVKSRMGEGFTLEDFKRVIDTKAAQWGTDEKMVKFLRPQTLFGPKFEGYLNESGLPKPAPDPYAGKSLEDALSNADPLPTPTRPNGKPESEWARARRERRESVQFYNALQARKREIAEKANGGQKPPEGLTVKELEAD